jgi:MFS family permease
MAASSVGAVLLPFGLIIGLLSRVSGGLADRYGSRRFLVGGSLLVAAAAGGLALNAENYWLGVFLPVVVMAFGMAAVVTPLTTVVMNSAPDARSGVASGINNAASRIAGLIAVAIFGALGALIFRVFGAGPDAQFGDLPATGDPARPALEHAFLAAYTAVMLLALVMAALAGAAAFLWLDEDERKPRAVPPG